MTQAQDSAWDSAFEELYVDSVKRDRLPSAIQCIQVLECYGYEPLYHSKGTRMVACIDIERNKS